MPEHYGLTEKQAIFDELFQEEGGIFIPDEDIKPVFDEIKAIAYDLIGYLINKYPKLSAVHVDFIADMSLNAYAVKYKDVEEYFIGINAGAYFEIRDIFSQMFANPTILPEIGDVSKEKNQEKQIDDINEFRWPNDEVRRRYVLAYSYLATIYLIFHEIGHIVRGHSGLNAQQDPSAKWVEYEFDGGIIKSLEPWILQTLEMDADSFAMNHIFLFLMNRINNNQVQELAFPLNEIYKDFRTFYKHFFFILFTFHRHLSFDERYPPSGLYDIDEALDKQESHPHPIVRLKLMFLNVTTFLEHYKYNIEEVIKGMFANTLKDAENAFATIKNIDPDLKTFFLNFMSQKGDEYRMQILGNWNKVYDMLEQFTFGTLPAKNQNPTPEKEW